MDDLDCCRTCGHFIYLHVDPEQSQYEGQRVFQHYAPLRCDPQTDNGCDCKEYVPEDNLEYLEWCHDKN